jgi:hypothetical protein
MEHLQPPAPLILFEQKAENWRKFKKSWGHYSIATGLDKKDATIQLSTFHHVVGPDAGDVIESFEVPEGNAAEKLKELIKQLEQYCDPVRNITYERHVFFTRNQKERECIDVYVKELQVLSKTCGFGDLRDSLIKDRIVGGIRDDRVRQRLLEKSDLSLDDAVTIVRAAEQSKMQSQVFKQEVEVAEVSKYRKKKNYHGKKDEKPESAAHLQRKCMRCGSKHPRNKCPAWNTTCSNCGKPNHFAKMCLFEDRKPLKKIQEVVVNEETDEEESEQEVYYIGEVSKDSEESKDWMATVYIEDKKTTLKLDTGAQCNLLPLSLYNKITKKPLDKSKVQLKTYSREKIQPIRDAFRK